MSASEHLPQENSQRDTWLPVILQSDVEKHLCHYRNGGGTSQQMKKICANADAGNVDAIYLPPLRHPETIGAPAENAFQEKEQTMGLYGIGQPVPREEDPRLLMGKGRFADDINLPGQARGHVLRSTFAHAVIRSIDAEAARAAPGVVAVLTSAELKVRGLGAQRPTVARKKRDGSPAHVTPQPLLADDRVRFVGQPVAFVVAETLAQAKDAAELIEIDYDPLPAVVTVEQATADSAQPLWDDNPGNEASFIRSATPPPPKRRSPKRIISLPRGSSSTASPPTPWSRAAASPNTTRSTTSTRSAARSNRSTGRAASLPMRILKSRRIIFGSSATTWAAASV